MDFNTLQQNLMQAKKVMNKVDGIPNGTIKTPSVPNTNLPPVSNNFNTKSINSVVNENASLSTPTVTTEAIEKSGLPEDIKKLMIDHPIPTVKFGSSVPDALIEGAAEKMKSMGMPVNESRKSSKPTLKKNTNTKKLSSTGLKTMIKNVVSESLEELIEQKLKKVISESKKTEDSVQIVIGNTILEGKITSTRDLS